MRFRSLFTWLCLSGSPLFGQDNFLVVIADDLGTDRVGVYEENPDPGHTPNIDRLAEMGILYRNAWVNPMCSPTRACLLTGLYGFRTGIGTIIHQGGGPGEFGLDPDIESLPDLLAGSHHSMMLGKWHLAAQWQGTDHAGEMGFDWHAGSLGNISDYRRWTKNVNGELRGTVEYATTDTTNDAIRAICTLPEPWLIWVAYHAPHRPFHDPPGHLHGYTLPPNPEDDPVRAVKAAAEALDTELGRLLGHVDLQSTTVFFLGDNGLVAEAVTPPQDPSHSKGSVFEGGIRVPFIVAGQHVHQPGRESDALISAVDLAATLAEIAGVPRSPRDSVSFLPTLQSPIAPSPREWLFAERFIPNGFGPYAVTKRAVRDERYKLLRFEPDLPVSEMFFDLKLDPLEGTDLLQGPLSPREQQAYDELKGLMARLLDS